jgi:hypothetical protein
LAIALFLLGTVSHAQKLEHIRDAEFSWNEPRNSLYVSLSFRDVIDGEIRGKLSRGLPTTLLLTGMLFAAGSEVPVASTYQSCRVTWHVWEEMYRVEVTTPEHLTTRRLWSPTLSGVLRRCAEARRLLVASSSQVTPGVPVRLKATVRVNPVSEELLKKLKHWVSLPSRNATASPGSALFSTFTGLFMQRIGDAERTLDFTTRTQVPE